MDFALSKSQRELQEQAAEAVERVIVPVAKSQPSHVKLSVEQTRQIYRGLAPLGYIGSTIPKEAGGAGLSYVDYGLLLEALAAGPVLLGEVVPPRTVHFLGTLEQKKRWLPGLLSGDLVSTAAITEPQAGSDLRNLQTTAVPKDGHFLVNGRKKWIKFGGICDMLTLLVVADAEKGAKAGTTRLMVERKVSPWAAQEIETVGIRNLSFAELEFKDVKVPRENQLGEAGAGTEAFYRAIEASRAIVGLQAVGIAQKALDLAVAYAKERVAFGRPLARFQAIQISLADAAAELDAARLLCLKALWILDSGQRCPREASIAKVYATEAAVRIAHAAMDSMGAFGLSADAGVERCWRDARMLTVIDGTSGIQRLIVGRELLGTAAFI
jgi:alkylation response protein AidB-like acyl-CoA dehydrogenase